MSVYSGGYNGAKEGYEIPAGTDIFVSVRSNFSFEMAWIIG